MLALLSDDAGLKEDLGSGEGEQEGGRAARDRVAQRWARASGMAVEGRGDQVCMPLCQLSLLLRLRGATTGMERISLLRCQMTGAEWEGGMRAGGGAPGRAEPWARGGI